MVTSGCRVWQSDTECHTGEGQGSSMPFRETLDPPEPPPEDKDREQLLKDELDSLISHIHALVDDVQLSLFSRFPRLLLIHTCLRARMDGNPEVVWCARPDGCKGVTRRSWSWRCERSGSSMEGGPVVICAVVGLGKEPRGVVKVATREEDARYGQSAVARLLAKVMTGQLKVFDDQQRSRGLRVSRLELQRAVLEAQEREREWIGFEIHDGIAQTLSAALCYLQALQRGVEKEDATRRSALIRTEGLLRQAMVETRSIVRGLAPPRLKGVGLVKALKEEARYFQEASGCSVEFRGSHLPLSEEVSCVLYRIATEALSNIRKHARAERVRLTVEPRDGQVVLEVTDWGRGFDVERVRRGMGLAGMRRRAESIGGSFSVSTTPGEGTTVQAKVPVGLGGQSDGR